MWAALYAGLWFVGGSPAAVLGEVVQSDSPRIARAGRIAFALLLGFDLLLAAVVFSVGNSSLIHMTRSLWWFTVLAGGVPLALVSGFAVRRGYAGHRPAVVSATLTTAVLYLAFPLGFVPATDRLTGLGRFEHDHRVAGIAIFLIPTLILLLDEFRRQPGETPATESGGPTFRIVARITGRSSLVGAAALILALLWLAGTNGYGMLIGFGVVVAGLALFLWHRHRGEVQTVLREMGPPGKP
jgi:hypothetical protein